MNLRQQIVEERIESIAELLNVSQDEAFVRLVHSLIVGESLHAFDPDDLVDGGQDKQIDVISIKEDGGSADIYLIQVKNSESFSSNALIQMGNGLRWVFDRPRKELASLTNTAFRDKIHEVRSVQGGMGPANIRVHVAFVTNGLSRDISHEFQQELRHITDTYANGTFEAFDARAYGADELVSLINAQLRRNRQIDADIRIRYDKNTPSLIRYQSQGLKGFVCTVPAGEIARIVNADPDGAVFDLNLRRYLGERGSVNVDIYKTCTTPDTSYEFWFLNNGITIVCDRVDVSADPDDPILKMENLQIVNGCQTATTLARAHQEGKLAPDVRVLVRAYEAASDELVSRVVLTTNNQNKITSRDLRANDPIQVDMESGFLIHDYLYERKSGQYDSMGIDVSRIIPNELVAQWFLAVVLHNPADARGRKYKIWGEHYTDIFAGQQVEPYIAAALIGKCVERWLRQSGYKNGADDVRRMLAKRGSYHIARITAHLWRGTDEWRGNTDALAEQLREIKDDCELVSGHIAEAFTLLESLINSNQSFKADIDRTLKSNSLNEAIDQALRERSITGRRLK
jgi:hypothetical protein